jgi:hypothetical protein
MLLRHQGITGIEKDLDICRVLNPEIRVNDIFM